MSEITTVEISKLFSLTSGDILNDLVCKNIIIRTRKGFYDLETSIKNYIIYLRSKDKESEELRKGDLANSKLRRSEAQASLSELELARRQGEMVPVRDVIIKIASEFARVRDRLLNLPGKAYALQGLKTKEIEKILKDAVWEALAELSTPDDGSAFIEEPDIEDVAETFDLQEAEESTI